MNRRFEKRLIFVWLALSAITFTQLALGSLGVTWILKYGARKPVPAKSGALAA